MKDPKDLTKNLELINTFKQVGRYKLGHQNKSPSYIRTAKILREKNRERIPFTIASKIH